MFAVYFPSGTGFMAGANISGDLKDPATAIPKGTIIGLLITVSLDLFICWTTGSSVVRRSWGTERAYLDLVAAENTTGVPWYLQDVPCSDVPGRNDSCQAGLYASGTVVQLMSAYGPLCLAGFMAAALSSALASLTSGAKVLQALCRDHLFPGSRHLERGYGANDEPRRAALLIYAIAAGTCMIGDLNAIAPLISNFYLATYGLINYSVFDASYANSPGFRPSFRYYNKWVSLAGGAASIGIMFFLSWYYALATFACLLALYVYTLHHKPGWFFYRTNKVPDANWGGSAQANNYRSALQSLFKLQHTEEHVKNYRPQLLVLTGNPSHRTTLLDFAAQITKRTALLMAAHVAVSEHDQQERDRLAATMPHWLKKRHTRAFYVNTTASSVRAGLRTLLQTTGIGQMRCNCVMLGYKFTWVDAIGVDALWDYVGAIADALDGGYGVILLRVPMRHEAIAELAHYVKHYADTNQATVFSDGSLADEAKRAANSQENGEESTTSAPPAICVTDASGSTSPPGSSPQFIVDSSPLSLASTRTSVVSSQASMIHCDPVRIPRASIMHRLPLMNSATAKSYIDVWWLYDDGGLSLLVPHLLRLDGSYLHDARLRVFTSAHNSANTALEKRNIEAMLTKFRIAVHSVTIVDSLQSAEASAETWAEYRALLAPFMVQGDNFDECDDESNGVTPRTTVDEDGPPPVVSLTRNQAPKEEARLNHPRARQQRCVTLEDMEHLHARTNRHLRTAELIRKESAAAKLIVL